MFNIPVNFFVDGIEYRYDCESDDNGYLEINVYNTASQEHVVGVFFDHDTETAQVEGPDFQESAPYFMLRDWSVHSIAHWAIAQIPDC